MSGDLDILSAKVIAFNWLTENVTPPNGMFWRLDDAIVISLTEKLMVVANVPYAKQVIQDQSNKKDL